MSKENSQEPGEPSRASWRDPTHYKSLLTLDRAGWAWKWLRRNPDYIARSTQLLTPTRLERPGTKLRVITTSDAEEARDWGLHFRGGGNPPGHRGLHLLAIRLGCLGAGRRDATGSSWRWRCFRPPPLRESGDGPPEP
ncbi:MULTISPECIES: transcriptional regulator domain-containing protein [Tistrella]|uniref:transcriptional regulator domain-containing protein n=1 Tax=Tistrella TaxID=171436 RepID=UPI0031F63701